MLIVWIFSISGFTLSYITKTSSRRLEPLKEIGEDRISQEGIGSQMEIDWLGLDSALITTATGTAVKGRTTVRYATSNLLLLQFNPPWSAMKGCKSKSRCTWRGRPCNSFLTAGFLNFACNHATPIVSASTAHFNILLSAPNHHQRNSFCPDSSKSTLRSCLDIHQNHNPWTASP